MILIAGGTGRLGTILVRRLAEQGHDVRVLTRDSKRAQHLAGDHVEVVRGDVRDRASLVSVGAGVDLVVSAVHGFVGPRGESPTTVDRDGNANLIELAQDAGAGFVLLSGVGAAPDSALELFRMKYAAEQHATHSGVPTTIVRASAFLEMWIEILERTAARSGRPLVFGRGDNPINFVSVIDVAALTEIAIADSSTRGHILEIGGPGNHTFKELAQAVQDAAGRNDAPRHVPRPMLRLMGLTVGVIRPELGRQARSAIVMDSSDMTFDSTAIHRTYPELPSTSLEDLFAHRVRGQPD